MVNQKVDAGMEALFTALATTRDMLWKEIEGLNDTQLNAKPKREKWSIVQNLHHLDLVEQSVISAIVNGLKKEECKEVPIKPVHLALDRTHKAETPEQMRPTETLMKEEQIRNLLQNSRTKLLEVLGSTNKQELTEKYSNHPMFGELSLYQWVEFLNFHEQRHLEQIREAKQALHQ
ncbi:MAG: DinB family protein [Ectobacillus sp.]